MMRRIVVYVAFSLLAARAQAQAPPSLTPEQWQQDVRYYVTELPKRHMNAYHAVSRADFDRAAQALIQATPTLAPHQVVVGMQELAAMVGDGHTRVHLPSWFHRYPLLFQWFGDDLRVTRAAPDAKRALGSRLTAIDGVPLAQLREKIARVISRDENHEYFLSTSAVLLGSAEILHAVGIARQPTTARFTFLSDDGQAFDLELNPGTANPLAPLEWESASAKTPLQLESPLETFWFRRIAGSDVMYVCWRGYKNMGDKARQMFEELDSSGARRLVIDLRGNGGGDFFVGRKHMVEPAMKRLKAGKLSVVYVVVGRRTFSAALANAIDFKKAGAILVGEPIGEKPNSYSENNEFTLPNSQIVASYSSKYYKFWPTDVPAILPDKSLPPSWPDFKKGEDPVMNWILGEEANASKR